ncbi:MAG: hypothetical protein KJ011_18365 [Burkholderiaceae bacterium]|nr:hypothetical protein [Burkholderiaceae bacterium]
MGAFAGAARTAFTPATFGNGLPAAFPTGIFASGRAGWPAFEAAFGAAFGATFAAALPATAALAATLVAPLAVVVLADAFCAAEPPALAGRSTGWVWALAAVFAAAALAAAGFLTDAEAAPAPVRDAVRGESFEDTLEVTFLDAGCLTDFATFASLSEVWIRQPMPDVGAGSQRGRESGAAGSPV